MFTTGRPTDIELRLLVEEWANPVDTAPEGLVHEVFAARAAERPDAIAVRFGDERLTYAELNTRANRLADRIRACGAAPDQVVGVRLERSIELIVAILAVLKADAAYLALDGNDPADRQRQMLTDAGVTLLVTTAEPAGSPVPAGIRTIRLDEIDLGDTSGENPAARASSDNLANLIYTSGSTGRPKAVAITHRGVVQLAREQEYAAMGPGEVYLLHSPVTFDAATFEIWLPLLNGGCLAIAPPGHLLPEDLRAVLTEYQVTSLFMTTMLFMLVVEHDAAIFADLRQLFFAGEKVSLPHVGRARAALPEVRLFNLYGPTEGTTCATYYPIPAADAMPEESVPIGRPTSHTETYILDESGHPAAIGMPGELHLGGPGVARGYLGQAALTAERFVPHPFSRKPGARLYRTGDQVAWLPDGTIQFVGRIDNQVKISGHRIEPGEIEAAIAEYPGVNHVVVVAHSFDIGDKRLIAYVSTDDGNPIDTAALQNALRPRLPDYMLPAAVISLPELPLTTSGKVDRRALPAPDRQRPSASSLQPRTTMSSTVLAVWSEVLGTADVRPTDSFIAAGGTSLAAMRVAIRLRAAIGKAVSASDVLSAGSAEELAAGLTAAKPLVTAPEGPPSPTGDRTRWPLSHDQNRLWLLNQTGEDTAYHVSMVLRLHGDLDPMALERAFSDVVARHGTLRTRFVLDDHEPRQEVLPPMACILPQVDLDGFGLDEVLKRAAELAASRFDLSAAPPWRAVLYRLGAGEHVLALAIHHLIFDGWSESVLRRELSERYAAHRDGRRVTSPPLPIQYTDHAVWQHEHLPTAEAGHLRYWRDQLAGNTPIDLPADRRRPSVRTTEGARRSFTVTADVAEGLRDLARQTDATPFMLFLAGWMALLGRYCDTTDVAVGTSMASRGRQGLDGLIGSFVHTLVMRTDLGGRPSFADLIGRVRQTSLDAFDHQDLPFEKLVAELAPDRQADRNPLFSVMFAYLNMPASDEEWPGLIVDQLRLPARTATFDLTLALQNRPDGSLLGDLEYSTALFDAETVDRIGGHYGHLLAGLVTAPHAPMDTIGLLDDAEYARTVAGLNAATAPLPGRGLHAVIGERAARSPEAIAVADGDQELGYGELEARANRLAHHLRDRGVGAEAAVAVRLPRGVDQVVALLAVLKAGGYCVPLDDEHPTERVTAMLATAAPSALITRGAERLADGRRAGVPSVVCLDADGDRIDAWPSTPPAVPEACGDRLAAMIFTSGSTGTPKGVALTHANVLSAQVGRAAYDAPPASLLLPVSFAFDVFLSFTAWTLCEGGRLVIPTGARGADLDELATLLRTQRVTHLVGLHHVHRALLAREDVQGANHLVLGIVGGESCPRELARQYRNHTAGARLVNEYGPTEASWGTFHVAGEAAGAEDLDERLPIGRPPANYRIYLLDSTLSPVPVGVPAELYIGGPGVARGYPGDRALTAERFVPDPFGGNGQRLYRTGDLARLRPDGDLEFLGRRDQQVKVRGFRIELGEVEAALSKHPGVRDTVVCYLPEQQQLIAYLAGAGASPGSERLREHMQRLLPEPMVPSAFVTLDTLPLTPNGKVDRAALVELGVPTAVVDEKTLPRTPAERAVAAVWCEVLETSSIDVNADFFEIGGQSLLAATVISRLRAQFPVPLGLRDLFNAPTVAGLAELIGTRALEAIRSQFGELASEPQPEAAAEEDAEENEAAHGDDAPVVAVSRDGRLPLSAGQRQLWLVDRKDGDSAAYQVPIAVRLDGPLDQDALRRALTEIVARHEILRTRIDLVDDEPAQLIDPPAEVVLPVIDAVTEDLEGILRDAAARPIDLARDLMLRPLLVRLGADSHVLLVIIHHIAFDGRSSALFFEELDELYTAITTERASRLNPMPLQYADYAAWQHARTDGPAQAAQLAYWRTRLSGLEAPELPADHGSRSEQGNRGRCLAFTLDAELAREVHAFARKAGATASMVLLAAFNALLGRYTGSTDISVGTPVTGRDRHELESLIGYFGNTLVMRTDLSGRPSFTELVGRVRRATLDGLLNREISLARVVEELAAERKGAGPLFSVMFAHDTTPGFTPKVGDLAVTMMTGPVQWAQFDLTLRLADQADGTLSGELDYATSLFDASTADRICGHYARLLRLAVQSPDQIVTALPLADDREHLSAWNDTDAPRPAGRLHELVERQVAETPHATAVEMDDSRLTYAELNDRADALARHLRDLGVGPDGIVAVCLPRCLDLPVALLAALKAGAAYLPMDPNHPVERLATVIGKSGARVLLTLDDIADTVADRLDGVVTVDPRGFTPGTPGGPLPAGSPESGAYVIFTSGSTGEPKAVLVPHRGIINRILWTVNRHGLGATDRVLQKTTPSFDAAVWEFFAPLVSGGTVVLATPGAERDPAMMITDIIRHGVTVLQGVPSLLRLFAEEPRLRDCRSLRLVFSAGEPLTTALAEELTGVLDAGLHNTYGPTECAIDVTAFAYRRGGTPGALVPIGGPIDNIRIRLVDDECRLVPVGVPGELCVSGAGLAHGYLNQPELTAARFVPDPYATVPGARMYRTGDRARWREDGSLEFLGRYDDQLKISGVRVEPAEIEAVLATHPEVTETVVAPWTDANGDTRLIGYVVGREPVPTSEELLAHAARRLPGPLVPAGIVFLDALPRTSSGKIARNGLPAPRFESSPNAEVQRPRSPIEEIVAEVWATVLGLTHVDLHTDFFSVGGHSLAAVRMMVRLRERLELDLPVRFLYESRTVARLAARIAERSAAERTPRVGTTFPPLQPADPGTLWPLSFTQEGLWLAERVEPGSYLAPVALAVDGPLDEGALRATITALATRHEVLRTRYVVVDAETRQLVDPPAPVDLAVADLTDDPDAQVTALSLVDEFICRPFDLAREAPLRALLVRLTPTDHVLVLLTHHIACDGWSLDVLARDLHELYSARVEARESELAPLPVRYGDYAAWQRRHPSDEHLDYWRERLVGTVPQELPTDRSRPAVRGSAGSAHTFAIPAPLVQAVVSAGEKYQATPFMTFLAGFVAFLAGYADGPSVTVAAPVAGRDRSEVEELIGCFINTILLKTDVSGDPTFGDLICRVRDTALDAYDHEAPFDRLIRELTPERDSARLPFTEVMFRLTDVARTPYTLPGLEIRPYETGRRTATFDLALTLTECPDRTFEGDLEYSTTLFDEATIAGFAERLLQLLDAVAAGPETPLSMVGLDPNRYDAVLSAPFQSVPHAIVERAAETPSAPAVIHGSRNLGYGELELMAGRVRARLAACGLRHGGVVAVCLERGVEAAAALVGVLGSGGVYVPFDPKHPAARMDGIFDELNITVVITHRRFADRFPRSTVIAVESLEQGPAAPVAALTADDLAYVIYTSGSTGRPKGVVVDHRAFAHHCATMTDTYALTGDDRWAVMASLTFDASLDQIAAPLTAGSTVVVVDPATTDPARLIDELGQHRVTVIDVTPAYYRAMLESLAPGDQRLSALKIMSVGGDRVTYTDAGRWADTGLPARFEVGYGPTEATITTTLHPVEPAELATARRDATIPIGRPLTGTPVYVLDANLRPVPPGAIGELYVGGLRVALGYHGRPELTADRFLPDPFIDRPGMRMYRSGDLVRRRVDGPLDFIGRADNQVKIRGFRVELGEIESVLATHPSVGTTVVIPGELRPGERRLAAYVVPDQRGEPITPRELVDFLRARLPEYMVPLTWSVLPKLPLMRNGKIDRAALPTPDWSHTELSKDETAPSSAAEKAICEIWTEALGLENVGVHTDFFEVGGNSMHAIQLALRLREAFGVDIELKELLTARTPAGQAQVLEKAIEADIAQQSDEQIQSIFGV